jgi:glycosyl transferase family WbsX
MNNGHVVRHAGRLAAAAGLLTALSLGPALSGSHSTVQAAAHSAGIVRAAAPRDASPTPSPSATPPVSATATAQGTPTTTPMPTLPPTRYVSKAVHRTNGYQIGAYYFSGWTHGQNDNLTPLLANGPLRKFEPLVGWYDDTQAQMDKNILQASSPSVGIDFFAFDWYDISRSRYLSDQSLNEGLYYFLNSQQRKRMNFCLTFIDQAPFLPRASEWPGLVKQWITFFQQPDYVRVNGKPLFIVFSPEHMRDIFGSSKNVHNALNYLRTQTVKAHLPGLTIAVGATLTPTFNPGRLGQFTQEGYDIMTGYNYHAVGNEKYRTPTPYKKLMQENEQMWDRVAKNIKAPYMPVITSGWDQRFSQREQKTAIIYAGRTPAQFGCYAAAARHWVDSNAKRTVKEKIVLVFAWNETGEGGAIIPNQTDHFGYTDALHHAFSGRKAPVCK